MRKKMFLISTLFFCLFNSSFVIDIETLLSIKNSYEYYSFIEGTDNKFTKIEVLGGLIDHKGTFRIVNDSFFDRLLNNDSLKYLEIQGCNLDTIPDKICMNKGLKSLLLRGNNIRTCNSNLKELLKLNFLDLDHNKIVELAPFVETLKLLNRINVISFSNNEILFIPESICQLNNLEDLHLRYNRIKEIPCCLSNMKKFSLNIQFNPIKEIPCCFSKKYDTWYNITTDNKIRIPECFNNSNIPENRRIQID